jgi:hypothetical protein
MWIFAITALAWPALRDRPLEAASLFALATLYPPFLFTLHLGQLNAHVMLGLVIVAWSLKQRWEVLAGVVIALAMLAKPHIGLMLPVFLITRHYRATVSCITTLFVLSIASIAAFGIEPWIVYIHDVLPQTARGLAYIANQSGPGVLSRLSVNDTELLFTPHLLTGQEGTPLLTKLFSLSVVSFSLWMIWRAKSAISIGLLLSTTVLTLLVASPVSTIHHYTWAYFAIVTLWLDKHTQQHFVGWSGKLSVLMAMVLLFIPWGLFFRTFLGRIELSRIAACNYLVGAMLLWGVCLFALQRATAVNVNAPSARSVTKRNRLVEARAG